MIRKLRRKITGVIMAVAALVLLAIPAALLAFWLVQRIHDGFGIDNGVV